jgi:hypothetical protein
MNMRKTDKTGDAVGRPSCQSTLLSDPNANFSVEMWRKPPRTRKKEGRHVGLDFYDLLIEVRNTAMSVDNCSVPRNRNSCGV